MGKECICNPVMNRPARKLVHFHVAWCPLSFESEQYEKDMEVYSNLPWWKKVLSVRPQSPYSKWH